MPPKVSGRLGENSFWPVFQQELPAESPVRRRDPPLQEGAELWSPGGAGGLSPAHSFPHTPSTVAPSASRLRSPGGVLKRPGGVLKRPGGVLKRPAGPPGRLSDREGLSDLEPEPLVPNGSDAEKDLPDGVAKRPGGGLKRPGGQPQCPAGVLKRPAGGLRRLSASPTTEASLLPTCRNTGRDLDWDTHADKYEWTIASWEPGETSESHVEGRKPLRPIQYWSACLADRTAGVLKEPVPDADDDLPATVDVSDLKAKSLPKIFKNLSDKDRERIRKLTAVER